MALMIVIFIKICYRTVPAALCLPCLLNTRCLHEIFYASIEPCYVTIARAGITKLSKNQFYYVTAAHFVQAPWVFKYIYPVTATHYIFNKLYSNFT